MNHAKQETELERFVTNHFDAIGIAIILLFGSAAFVFILMESIVLVIVSMLLMLGFLSVNIILLDGPARRAMRTWEKNLEQQWDSKAAITK